MREWGCVVEHRKQKRRARHELSLMSAERRQQSQAAACENSTTAKLLVCNEFAAEKKITRMAVGQECFRAATKKLKGELSKIYNGDGNHTYLQVTVLTQESTAARLGGGEG